jgi:hypothetical protein
VLSVESGGVVRIRRDERVAELRPTLIIYIARSVPGLIFTQYSQDRWSN